MKKYIIFGCSENLSNLFDIIHANGGKVYKIYQNMPEIKRERAIGLRERVALLGYDVKVYDSLHAFEPEKRCLYTIGPTTPVKYRLIEALKSRYSLEFSTLIHPTVILGSNVYIGEGVIIDVQATIAPNAYLGDFCCILRCSSLGHDAQIGKYSLISVGVSIGGSTHIGERCKIGMKATILERLSIEDWTVIGAGSLVNKDMPGGVVAYGVPAKVIRENHEIEEIKLGSQINLPRTMLARQ